MNTITNKCIYDTDPALLSTFLTSASKHVLDAIPYKSVLHSTAYIEWIMMSLLYTYVPPSARPTLSAELMKKNVWTSPVLRHNVRGLKLSYRLAHLTVKCPFDVDTNRRRLLKMGQKLVPIVAQFVSRDLCERVAKCLVENTKASSVFCGTRAPPNVKVLNPLHLNDFYTVGFDQEREWFPEDAKSDLFQVNIDATTERGKSALDVTVPFMLRFNDGMAVASSWEVIRLDFVSANNIRYNAFRHIVPLKILYAGQKVHLPFFDVARMAATLRLDSVQPGTLGFLSAFDPDIHITDPFDAEIRNLVREYVIQRDNAIPSVNLIEAIQLEDNRY